MSTPNLTHRNYLQEIKRVVSDIEKDYEKAFVKQNQSASRRMRKRMIELRNILHEARSKSLELEKS